MDIPGGKLLAQHVAKVLVVAYGNKFDKWERQKRYIGSLNGKEIRNTSDAHACANPKCAIVLPHKEFVKCLYCWRRCCPDCLIEGECHDCVVFCQYQGCKHVAVIIKKEDDVYIGACTTCTNALCMEHTEFYRFCALRACFGTDCMEKHECKQKSKRAKLEALGNNQDKPQMKSE